MTGRAGGRREHAGRVDDGADVEAPSAEKPERPDRIGRQAVRIGLAAEMIGVSIDTLRRWAVDGRIRTSRSEGGQRLVPIAEVSRLVAERRRATVERPIVAVSARNRFAGIVTAVERDGLVAIVEVLAGPHRLVSLMTSEALDELGLRVGDEAVCVVKATNVVVEVPSGRDRA